MRHAHTLPAATTRSAPADAEHEHENETETGVRYRCLLRARRLPTYVRASCPGRPVKCSFSLVVVLYIRVCALDDGFDVDCPGRVEGLRVVLGWAA